MLPRSQLTRAAIFLGATALAAPACGGSDEPDTIEEEGGSGDEDITPQPMYGAPPPDDGGDQGGDTGTVPPDDYGGPQPMYGVPPEG